MTPWEGRGWAGLGEMFAGAVALGPSREPWSWTPFREGLVLFGTTPRGPSRVPVQESSHGHRHCRPRLLGFPCRQPGALMARSPAVQLQISLRSGLPCWEVFPGKQDAEVGL